MNDEFDPSGASRRDFFKGVAVGSAGRKDVAWLKPDGHEMTPEEWEKDFARCLGMWLNGGELPETDERGHVLQDASFLVLFNAHHDLIEFQLPNPGEGGGWRVEVDTFSDTGDAAAGQSAPTASYPLQGRSLVLLRQTGPGQA